MDEFKKIQNLLERGVRESIYPGAVLVVAKCGVITFFKAVGNSSVIPEPVPMRKETIFDLASLTKPLATTLCLMKLVDKGNVGLNQPLSDIFPTACLRDKKGLTLRMILNHSAGFRDWKPFYLELIKYEPEERKRIIRDWILEEPFAYRPGTDCVYSDLGFIMLEWVIETISGYSMKQFFEKKILESLLIKDIFLFTDSSRAKIKKENFASTEDCPWRKRLMQGEVHDENAFALGGYSGHAGLFGDAKTVFSLVNVLREHYIGKRHDCLEQETIKEFFRRQDIINGCTWALGWDTPSHKDSSSGRLFSSNSVGHLGFTGTSLWMDLDKDIIVVFLTNRIHPTRNNIRLKGFRPILHDAVMEAVL